MATDVAATTDVATEAGGGNNLFNSSLEGLLCFISPLSQVRIRILHIQTRILHIILHRKNIFTRSLVSARTYPPPDSSNGSSYAAMVPAHSPNIVKVSQCATNREQGAAWRV